MNPVLANAYAIAVSSPIAAAIRGIARAAANAWIAMSNRWVAKRLCDLTDYELDDIGLTRDDLHRAFAAPLSGDPSRHLAGLSQSRAFEFSVAHPRAFRGDTAPPVIRGRVE